MKGTVITLFRVETDHKDVPEFVYQPEDPHGERRRLALRSWSAFTYYQLATNGALPDIGKRLLVDLTMFFRLENIVEGRPEEEGLAENPFLTMLRKNLCGEGPILCKLPDEVYKSLN